MRMRKIFDIVSYIVILAVLAVGILTIYTSILNITGGM